MTTNPSKLISDLLKAGDTQADIEAGTGIRQATISRILTGAIKDPRSSTVSKLISYASKRLADEAGTAA